MLYLRVARRHPHVLPFMAEHHAINELSRQYMTCRCHKLSTAVPPGPHQENVLGIAITKVNTGLHGGETVATRGVLARVHSHKCKALGWRALFVRAVSCADTVIVLPCGYEGPCAPFTAPVTDVSAGRATEKYLRPEIHLPLPNRGEAQVCKGRAAGPLARKREKALKKALTRHCMLRSNECVCCFQSIQCAAQPGPSRADMPAGPEPC